MAEIFRSSTVWVVEFTYQGRARTWYMPLPAGTDAARHIAQRLEDWYGPRAQLQSVRPASPQEERNYVRGEVPKNMLCPTGRAPRSGLVKGEAP